MMPLRILPPLIILISLNGYVVGSTDGWTFDEDHNFAIYNKPSISESTIITAHKECKYCPPINSTDCIRLQQEYTNSSTFINSMQQLLEPKLELCFSPSITYYGGLDCLIARFSCYHANLFVNGTHIKTRENRIWDLRMPYKGAKYYENRWPYNGISSIAQCTAKKEWLLALGIRPYSIEKIIIQQVYCLP
uniref:Gnk2-homologous domain-containing protein n=1 Tax=Setaria digitata TaxID=48799 RepID=A0A915PVR1_9BILA